LLVYSLFKAPFAFNKLLFIKKKNAPKLTTPRNLT
jgi:hypothetical protein